MSKYLIAVGGTGMRCLESFVHLCAIGMMDNEEINVLIIDTDNSNGNKSRTHDIINAYIDIKKDEKENSSSYQDTFFSSIINLYEFNPIYKDTFSNIAKDSDPAFGEEEEELVNLLFETNTQEFNLEHGYRAQTHLGSYLMYHEIIDRVRNKNGNDGLTQFVQKIVNDKDNPKVFVLGSLFGGTGASSIPIIPRAISEAAQALEAFNLGSKIKFGATLLTQYFTFNPPTDEQLATTDKVIANGNGFGLNSQAALMYYDSETIKNDFDEFYMIGWPYSPKDFSISGNDNKFITGGELQENPAHIVDLISAFAAYNFFTKTDDGGNLKWFYKTIEENNGKPEFKFSDFVGDGKADEFKKKISAFYSMCLMLNIEYKASKPTESEFKDFLNAVNVGRITGDITEKENKAIDLYIKNFSFSIDNNKVIPGWLYQVKDSSGAKEFLFRTSAFKTNYKELLGIEWLNISLESDVVKTKLFGKASFDFLKNKMSQNKKVSFTGISKANEQLLKWLYDTLTEAF